MSNPFDEDHKPAAGHRIGLVVPRLLSSAELDRNGGNHNGIEVMWPVLFYDADEKVEPLTDFDLECLARVGVTEAEFWEVELSRTK